MKRNVEIKARIDDFPVTKAKVQAMVRQPFEILTQRDVYFQNPKQGGRIKLRFLAPDRGDLIYYERPDDSSPKLSNYGITKTSEPSTLENVLTRFMSVVGVVSKTRWLAIQGQIRIHLDEVEHLGTFLELEVVLREEQTEAEGRAILEEILEALDISSDHFICNSYIDLLLEHKAKS